MRVISFFYYFTILNIIQIRKADEIIITDNQNCEPKTYNSLLMSCIDEANYKKEVKYVKKMKLLERIILLV